MRGPFSNYNVLDVQEVYHTKLDCHLSENAAIYFLKPPTPLFFPQAGKTVEKWVGPRGKPLGN